MSKHGGAVALQPVMTCIHTVGSAEPIASRLSKNGRRVSSALSLRGFFLIEERGLVEQLLV